MTTHVRRTSLVSALLVSLPLLVIVGPAHAAASCLGERATIVGSGSPDILVGTPKRDVIVGKGGRDRISGRGGNDLICGGGRHDEIRGGAGSDKISGQRGADFILGGTGDDLLILGKGLFQVANGQGGDDTIRGLTLAQGGFDLTSYRAAPNGVQVNLAEGTATGEGKDRLINIDGVQGSRFDDNLVGHTGSNFLNGLGGNDTISGSGNRGDFQSPDTISEFRFDFMTGDAGDDTITGGQGINVAGYGSSGTGIDADLATGEARGQGVDTLQNIDVIVGSAFTDTLQGDDEANGFEGGGGDDTIDGRGGVDVLIFVDADKAVANLAEGTAAPTYSGFGEREPEVGSMFLTDLENIWGSEGRDRLTGDEGPNEIYGLAGADNLGGGAGLDLLIGGQGDDSANGGTERDICDAESETECEEEPAPRRGSRRNASGRTGWRALGVAQ